MEDLKTYLMRKLIILGIDRNLSDELSTTILFLSVLIISLVLRYIAKRFLVRIINSIFKKTKNEFDDILIEHRIFKKLTLFVPGLIMIYSSPLIINSKEALGFILAILKIYITVVSIITFSSLISALHDMYKKLPISANIQIVGYVQVVKILVYVVGAILILSVVLDQSPYALLTSIGAMAAILLLVFKDTILGFVANVQLSANNMVKPGDWITIDDKADGTVLDISLTTVKVQNFDKTISMLPTSSLVQNSFINWKGMEQSDGRRIKNSITIQIDTITFINKELLKKLSEIEVLKPTLKEYEVQIDGQKFYQRETNIGLFRVYIETYLKSLQDFNPTMIFLVRHLQNTGEGVPIEIYFFSKDKTWKNIEILQAKVIEHLYAIVPQFELRAFQRFGSYNSSQYPPTNT